MLSLQKTYDVNELVRWMGNKPIIGTWKIDGNSVSLVYERGVLKEAKTRGNGVVGEVVTDKVVWVSDVVRILPEPIDIEIRGELYCNEEGFSLLSEAMEKLNLELPTSPRNIVAGLLGRKQYAHLMQYVSFFAFEPITDNVLHMFKTERQRVDWLQGHGFNVPHPRFITNEQELNLYLEEVKTAISESDIGIDGAVFTYDDLKLHGELGVTAHHPRYKMSFKWQGATATSKIENILWSTSRLGIVTPVAVIRPVNLSGATITNVTLHNASMVKNYHLKPGDEIEIVRSGEVIPKFLRVTKRFDGPLQIPEKCPECKTPLVYDEVRLNCPNTEECPAQKMRSILNWIEMVEIEDMSEKRLGLLMDRALVKTIPDLYRLTEKDFLSLPQTKEKMAQKLMAAIDATRSVDLVRFLCGLGIQGAGKTSWQKLLTELGGLETLLEAKPEEIAAMNGFAEKSADQIVSGLRQKKSLIKELLKVGVNPQWKVVKPAANAPLLGKQFVITGALSRPREEIAELIQKAGGQVSSSVSKNTFALVTEETDSNSSKMQKARSLGTKIWSEAELLRAIKQ
jgi:DNA ligase (NAD+)